jgi:hypothetical protein
MNSHFSRFGSALGLCFILAAFIFFANPVSIFAQDLDDVTISGKITDANGAVVMGAAVTATLISENQERTATTDAEGRYRLIELKPGVYTVRVAANGFAALEQKEINTLSGQNLQINFALTPASVRAETVVVDEDSTPAVDTTRTVVGGTVSQREIEELPNPTRSPLDLVFTLGGVTEESLSTRDLAEDRQSNPETTSPENGIFSLSGGAPYSNNLTIDGFDNNDDRIAQERFQPSLDAVAEVQVITNQFSSEYGRASGGRVNLRTRGGTKRFRGRAFYFFRDDSLNANTFNNNRRGLERPEFTEHNPGFTFGGPVPFGYFKNKTFFFTAYEYTNFLDTILIDTVVPVEQNPNFPLPAPIGGGTSRAEVRTGGGGALIGSYIRTVNTPNRNQTFLGRIDHNFNDSHNLTVSYQLGRRRNQRQGRDTTNRLEEVFQETFRDTDAVNFTDNYVFSPKVVNQFRFQYSRFLPDFATDEPEIQVALISIRDSANNRTTTLIGGNSTAGFANLRRETRYQFQDTLTAVVGSHTFKFGADVQRINSQNSDLEDATGTFNFATAIDFLNNAPSRYRQNFGTTSDIENTYFGVFVQDDWRVFSNLNLSLGLRYEREEVVDDNNNLGPRVALAYSPFNDGKGVIRAGFGVFYNRVLLRTVDDYTIDAGSFSFDSNRIPTAARTTFLNSLRFPNTLSLQDLQNNPDPSVRNALVGFNNDPTSPLIRLLDPNLKIPESYQANVGFEREIGKGFVFEANLTFNRTVRLWREVNANAPRLPADTPDRDGNGIIELTDYLLGVNSGRSRFEIGSPTDPTGLRATAGGSCTNAASNCVVNLRTLNTSEAANSPYARALEAVNGLRPNPNLVQIEQVSSLGESNYQGLILELRRRFRSLGYGFGASFRAAYTLSRIKDDGINNTTSAQIVGDFDSEYAASLLDRRHRLAFSGVFEMPRWLAKLRLSPLVRFATGAPFNVGLGGVDRNLDDIINDRPNFNGSVKNIRSRQSNDAFSQDLANAFSFPTIGSTGGNLPRNAGRGPKLFIFDLSVSREIRFNERLRLRPSIEFDNILNQTVFSFGSEFIDFTSLNPNATPAQRAEFEQEFLVPTRTLRQRQIRFGVRFDF